MSLRNRVYRSFTIILIVSAITPRVQTFTIKPKTLTVDNEWSSTGLLDDINKDTREKYAEFPYENSTKESASNNTANATDNVQDALKTAATTEDAKTQQSFSEKDTGTSEMSSIVSSTDVDTDIDDTTEDTKTSTDPAFADVPVKTAISDSTDGEYTTETTNDYGLMSSAADTTQITSQSQSITTTSYWNKYKFVERKRGPLASNQEHTETPTTQTELKESTSQEQSISEKTSERPDYSTTDTDAAVEDDKNQYDPKDNDVMSSVRSGFIDLTAASTTITEKLESTSNGRNFPTIPSNIVELEEVDMSKDRRGKSRSQLVSDELNEEQLMIEESISNRQETSKKYKDQEDYSSKETTVSNRLVDPEFVTKANKITTERQSVKSIGDKNKTTSIYTVNPNYKPLKKIDVQPPKPFLRNPDDNSWRNESISSLGIVFKPKNATKAFTEVLKNKTESLLNNLEGENKSEEQPEELRIRLGKIGELRKSKKKNKLGETVYTDYDSTNEFQNGPQSKEDIKQVVVTQVSKNKTESLFNSLDTKNKTQEQSGELRIKTGKIEEQGKSKNKNKLAETVYTDYDSTDANEFLNSPQSKEEIKKVAVQTIEPILDVKTTTETTTLKNKPLNTSSKAKKFNVQEYYDLTKHDDDEDNYYDVMPKMELKKFKTSRPPFKPSYFAKPNREFFDGRQATIQYFPPVYGSKVVDETKSTLPSFRREDRPKLVTLPHYPVTVPSIITEPTPNEENGQYKPYPSLTKSNDPEKGEDDDRSYYYTHPPAATAAYELDRPAYVIKHFGNLFKHVQSPEEPPVDVVPAFTVAPPVYSNQEAEKPQKDLDYDYEDQLRKDVIDKFVENFNENRERFKEDFPVLYNSSIVHQKAEKNGKVLASSNAFLKRLYTESPVNQDSSYFVRARPYDPDCDKTVELSPAYELHYYVPDEEEKEEIETKLTTAVYSYRL